MRPTRAPAAFASVLVLVGSGLFAYARMDPGDGRVLQYQGQLQLDGARVDGDHDFRFGLFNAASADAACLVTSSLSCGNTWAEEQTGVGVKEGQFAVKLGESAAIYDADLAASALFLAIAVKAPTEQSYTLLAGKHEIVPVPWASRAAAAKDYTVTGALTVGNGMSVTGNATATGDMNAGGNVTASGSVIASGVVRGQGIWEKVYETTLTTANDHVVSGLNGDVDRRYRIVLQGFINGTATNNTIGVRPNGITTGYSGVLQHWNGHEPTIRFLDVTGLTGIPLTGQELLPIAVNHWGHDGYISATAEMSAATGMARVMRSDDVFNSSQSATFIMQTTHAGSWVNTTTNITSLTFTFNGATDFEGLVTIYRMR